LIVTIVPQGLHINWADNPGLKFEAICLCPSGTEKSALSENTYA